MKPWCRAVIVLCMSIVFSVFGPSSQGQHRKSADDLAQDFSEDGTGIGFVIIKGQSDAHIDNQTMLEYFVNRVFAPKDVMAKVFIEQGDVSNTIYEAFVKGHDVWGMMGPAELKENLPMIIGAQKGLDNRRALEKQSKGDI